MSGVGSTGIGEGGNRYNSRRPHRVLGNSREYPDYALIPRWLSIDPGVEYAEWTRFYCLRHRCEFVAARIMTSIAFAAPIERAQ